uniref:Terminal uridylyl transferase 4 n=1 Tax=Takifugu rubripes TaxID=31033 RepID=A0A3B5KEM8_TAKRU
TFRAGRGRLLTLTWVNGVVLPSVGLKSGPLVCAPVEEGAEEKPVVEEGSITEQQLGLRQAEERLCRDYIHRLLKQSPEYPNYQYLCKLCSVHIENIQGAHKHIKEKRHKKNIMEKQEENELRALPPASAAHLRALDISIHRTMRQNGISEDDFGARKAVVTTMEEIIRRHLPACSLRLYGSTLTQFAFKTSDINIDVTHPSSMTQPEVLIQELNELWLLRYFSAVELAFLCSGLLCKVTAGNDVACLTTNHLAALAKLEPRLVPLVLAFRHWARLCHIDCQAEGGIPSYSFALMVIFFLQQRKEPVLPVYLGHWIEGFESDSTFKLGGLALVTTRVLTWPIFPLKSRLTFDLSKSVSLGQLWLELLRFYTLEFALEEYIISIRFKGLLSREMKNWPRRRLAIEDPFALKRNVARSLNSQMVFEYIQERFRTAYKYFACPQRRHGGGALRGHQLAKHGTKVEELDGETPIRNKEDGVKDDLSCRLTGLTEDESDKEDGGSHLSTKMGEKTLDTSLMDMVLSDESKPSPSPNGLLDSEEEMGSVTRQDVPSDHLHYVFDKMIFTGGKPPTVVCSICKRDGHLKDECPEDFKKIELKPLPAMTERFREILDGLCRLCYFELSPTHVEQQKREQILASLERFIRKEYNAQLCLFGSSKNGFGFRDSDLDICMTLEGHETAEMLNCKEIIEGLAKVLKKHTGDGHAHKRRVCVHMCVQAQHNTRMLATYAALDPRVQYLGYTMKVFAKRCDIGDASRGSLSSYAYILMVLYFLQQRQPPVIPVLQEIFDGTTVPQRMVDGWNAFFCDDLSDLVSLASGSLNPNTESVGELWLGLLRFYTEEFDFKEHVISIRQKKRLTTFEKQWTSKCIAIEDPFDLNHNLGAGVSRKMTNFIMKAFINGRKLFGTPFYPIPSTEDYFFDSKVLTDGELAPNDRCCRICGKIGHYMKDCPKRRRLKKENDKDEDVKEEERELKDRRCFQCGDPGHVRRDCPEYRHLKQRAAAASGVPQHSGSQSLFLWSRPPMTQGSLSGSSPAHVVRNMGASQSLPIPQAPADGPGRTRQSSECVSKKLLIPTAVNVQP